MSIKESVKPLPKPISEYDLRKEHPFRKAVVKMCNTYLSISGKMPVAKKNPEGGCCYTYRNAQVVSSACREVLAYQRITEASRPRHGVAARIKAIQEAAADRYPRLGLGYFSTMKIRATFAAPSSKDEERPSFAQFGRRFQIALDALVGLPLTLLDPARTERHMRPIRKLASQRAKEGQPGVFPLELIDGKGSLQSSDSRVPYFRLHYQALGMDCSLSIPCISLAMGLLRQTIYILSAGLDLYLEEVTTPNEVRDTILEGSYADQFRLVKRLRPWLNFPALRHPLDHYPIVWRPANAKKLSYWQAFQRYVRYIHREGGHVASGSIGQAGHYSYADGQPYNGFSSFLRCKKQEIYNGGAPKSKLAEA